MAHFTTRADLFVVPVQVHQRQLQPVVVQIGADQVDHHRRAGHHRLRQRQVSNGAQVQLELADGGTVLRPVAAVVHARRQLVDQQTRWRDETLHCHHAHIAQLVHDGGEHLFRLRLLVGIGLRENDAGAQNAVLMQVMRQGVEHRAAIVPACAHQRHFPAEVNALLNDALAVAVVRQFGGVVRAQAPLPATVVATHATLHNRQLAQHREHVIPLAFVRQQLPRRGRKTELIEKLFLRETVGDDREYVAVHKGVMARQFAGQGGFRPAFNFGGDHALMERHRFRLGIQPDGPDGNTQRLTGLTQHAAKLTITENANLLHAAPRGSGLSSTSSVWALRHSARR